jgi:NAD-dependent SIR2 family protein deacetylase
MDAGQSLARAAQAIAEAEALLIGAGAGMGVDSGLPDFRGDQGFWRAYPRYAELGLNFAALANPRWFKSDPHLAWGFYGHRLNLYRTTVPHGGFHILRDFAAGMRLGSFVFTSNVDGQFQRAGFSADRIAEHHGSIHAMQCVSGCTADIISADGFHVEIDETTLRAKDPLPRCPRCSGLLRPNILMFGDWDWNSEHTRQQEERLEKWVSDVLSSRARLAIVECGAGLAIPSVRNFCADLARKARAPLIRCNPREPDADVRGYEHIGIALGAHAALKAIVERRAGA